MNPENNSKEPPKRYLDQNDQPIAVDPKEFPDPEYLAFFPEPEDGLCD